MVNGKDITDVLEYAILGMAAITPVIAVYAAYWGIKRCKKEITEELRQRGSTLYGIMDKIPLPEREKVVQLLEALRPNPRRQLHLEGRLVEDMLIPYSRKKE